MKKNSFIRCAIFAIAFFLIFPVDTYADAIEDYELGVFYTAEEIDFLVKTGLKQTTIKHVNELCDVLGYDADQVIKERYYGILLGPYESFLEDMALKKEGKTSTAEYDEKGGVIYKYYDGETCTEDLCLCIQYYGPDDEPEIVSYPDGSFTVNAKREGCLGIRPKYYVKTSKGACKAQVNVYDEAYLDQAVEAAVGAGMPAFPFAIYDSQWGDLNLITTGNYIEGVEAYRHDENSRKYYKDGQEIDEDTALDLQTAYVETFEQFYDDDTSPFVGSDAETTNRKLKQLKEEKNGKRYEVDCERDFLITQEEVDDIRSVYRDSTYANAPIKMSYFDPTSKALSDYVNYTAEFVRMNEEFVDVAKDEMLRLINDFRAENGLKPLDNSSVILNDISETRANELVYFMAKDHSRPNGEPLHKQFPVGENSCYVECMERSPQELAQAMFDMWANSEGHRANMLDPYYHSFSFSISMAKKGDKLYYYGVQDFSSQYAEDFDRENSEIDTSIIIPEGKLFDENGNPKETANSPILQNEGFQLLVGNTPLIKGRIPVYAETDMKGRDAEMCKVTIRDANYGIICVGYTFNDGYFNKKYAYFSSLTEISDGTVIFQLGGSDSEVQGNLGVTGELIMESDGVPCDATMMYNAD